MENKLDTMVLITRLKNLKNCKNEIFIEQMLIEILEKYSEKTFFNDFIITLMKVASCSEVSYDLFSAYLIYCDLSKSYEVYDFEVSQLFYNLYHGAKMEETVLNKGGKSERAIFSDADKKIKSVLKSFCLVSYDYKIKNKYIDMLGKCEKTGKNIIVEFKVKNKCGAHQLYSYDKMLGGNNILVSVTEKKPKTMYGDIIYITVGKSKDYEIESGDIIRNQIEY